MKRISSILAIALVLFAGIIIAVSANNQDDGNSTIQNETNVTVPIGDTSGNQSDVTNGTNDTNGTVPPTNSIYISVLDVGAPGETANQEYVKIANKGTTAVSMKGWTIKDAGAVHTYLFPAYTLTAKSTVTIRSGVGTNTANTLYWNKQSFVWNNNGDTAYLYNSQGNLVSSRRTNGPTNETNETTNGTNETTNGTNETTNGTNATVPPASTTPVTVPPKTIPGKIIPASTIPIKVVVDEVKYTNINNEGVQITALHPLSGGVEYVSITNFNDFTAHLEGYKIHEIECNNTIVFKDIDILPGHTLRVYTGNHQSGPDIASAQKLNHIYNKNDTVKLICACGNVISTFEK